MATVIQANVIDVSAPQYVKTARGGYNFIELAYKKDGKVEGKKITDFGHENAKFVFEFLKSVKSGDVLNVTLEKVNDYWTWVGVEKDGNTNGAVSNASNSPVASAPVSAGASKAGRVVGSNYETPDERANRQRLIVRQSSLSAAVALKIHNFPKGQVEWSDVLELAEVFTKWVFKTDFADMKDDTL